MFWSIDLSKKIVKTIPLILGVFLHLFSSSNSFAQVEMTIGYLEKRMPKPPILSNLEVIPDDEGIAGVELALKELGTTGKFLGHTYKLEKTVVDIGVNTISAAKSMLSKTPFIIIKADKKTILEISDLAQAKHAIILNVAVTDNDIRGKDCRKNLLHTMPSRSMLSDALAQFAYKKRWKKLALIKGAHDDDLAFAKSLERSFKKFQLNVVANKTWEFNADMRRNAAQEVPLFTQDIPDYDMLIVSDERHDFGRYILYNTWLARPIAGSEGLVPAGWSGAVEQHGAAQLQSRFYDQNNRSMRSVDYASWSAVRALGEAMTRIGVNDTQKIRKYLLSDKFKLAGFKGRKLTFRNWNGQLRQPIPLTHSRAVVALAPLDGFLHQHNELDTLGTDRPESKCREFIQ